MPRGWFVGPRTVILFDDQFHEDTAGITVQHVFHGPEPGLVDVDISELFARFGFRHAHRSDFRLGEHGSRDV